MWLQFEDLAAAQAHFTFCQTLLINRVVFQFSAEEVAQHSGNHHRNQRHRDTNRQQRQVAHAHRLQDTGEEDHRRGNRRGGNSDLGRDDGNGERTRRTDTLFFRHFGNHR